MRHQRSGGDDGVDDAVIDEVGDHQALLGDGHRAGQGHHNEAFLVARHGFQHVGAFANLASGEGGVAHGADKVIHGLDLRKIERLQRYQLVGNGIVQLRARCLRRGSWHVRRVTVHLGNAGMREDRRAEGYRKLRLQDAEQSKLQVRADPVNDEGHGASHRLVTIADLVYRSEVAQTRDAMLKTIVHAEPRLPEQNFQIGIVQMSCTPEPEENLERAIAHLREAAALGAEIVCLPELFLTQYFCQREDIALFDLAEPIPGPTTKRLGEVARELKITIVASLFERRAPGIYHNTAAIIDTGGKLDGIYRKMHIPDNPLYYEKFYFTPGDLGFKTFETDFGKSAR